MKTDELIALLSTDVEPVDHRQLVRVLCVAVAAGLAVALCATVLGLGLRPDFTSASALTFLILKVGFAAGVVTLASAFLAKLARPGGEKRTRTGIAALPFVGILLLAAISLASAPGAHWEAMLVDDMWLECLLSIPVIAVVPFAAIIWAMRKVAAPTDLVRTGAFAGLVAGGVSAMGYALHCTGDSLPYIALWYGGTIALCTLAGALLGPRLLRW